MAGHHQHLIIAKLAGQAVAFVTVQGQPLVVIVISDATIEHQGVLLAHLQAAILQQGKGGGVRLVGVQDGDRARRVDVHTAMNEKRRRLDLSGALQDIALFVTQQKRRGGDFRPMQAAGVDQEQIAAHHPVVIGDGDREMVANPLVQIIAHRPAQSAGQIRAQFLQIGHHVISS